jgi:CheY-like chemotaxis protein
VRAVARQVLERLGYAVLEAPDGATGLRVAERHSGPIHLLLTNVAMPGMSGRQLAERLRGVRPDTRVLFTSGAAVGGDADRDSREAHLSKPFTPEALARAVRHALERDV